MSQEAVDYVIKQTFVPLRLEKRKVGVIPANATNFQAFVLGKPVSEVFPGMAFEQALQALYAYAATHEVNAGDWVITWDVPEPSSEQ
jgi:hypothetical protein